MPYSTGKRLTRNRTDKRIAGVCGGLARYFDIDPVVVRLLALILLVVFGSGFLVYLICWIIIPEED